LLTPAALDGNVSSRAFLLNTRPALIGRSVIAGSVIAGSVIAGSVDHPATRG